MKFEGGEATERPAARAITQLGEGAGWPEQAIKEHGPGLYKFGSWDCVRRTAENCLRRCDAQSRGLKSVISVEVGFAVCVRGPACRHGQFRQFCPRYCQLTKTCQFLHDKTVRRPRHPGDKQTERAGPPQLSTEQEHLYRGFEMGEAFWEQRVAAQLTSNRLP